MAILVDGKIPAFNVCPYWYKCSLKKDGVCEHLGEQHNLDYFCAYARSFEFLEEELLKERFFNTSALSKADFLKVFYKNEQFLVIVNEITSDVTIECSIISVLTGNLMHTSLRFPSNLIIRSNINDYLEVLKEVRG